MSYVEMPKLSDTMTEGTVVKWRKAVGDIVRAGDVIAEIETDKAVMELESFDDGTLKEILVAEGGKARIGQKLALLLAPGETEPKKAGAIAKSAKAAETVVSEAEAAPSKAGGTSQRPAAPSSPSSNSNPPPAQASHHPGSPAGNGRVKASPLAKKIAGAKGLNLRSIRGSGPGGRILARDIESTSAPTPDAPPATAIPTMPAVPAGPGDRRVPLSGMSKIIAERLLASKTQIPHFYLNIEVDAGQLVRTRAQLNEHLEKSGQGKLTFNDFVLKAAVLAATRVPRVNASFAGDAVIEYGDIHLSVAVAIEEGLVTPVIRQAQKRSLREISEAVKDLATRARTKKLKPEEYQGGTITVSNLGSYGIDSFSAVINPPQAIILAVGAIVKKPVLNAQDQIVPGHRLAIGLSADHRVVDGAIGAQYLAELRQLLENPMGMLL
ncbi:MAG TPA: pyruvate dehydrogenase complex dihydrolipoamide acetyltransferase [Verrucomicrobiae bacterium]|nr:pyruvate dehydrogenase complex dihydrolipoamide acetyltransferase [Verrucomicrobiae bacterium]